MLLTEEFAFAFLVWLTIRDCEAYILLIRNIWGAELRINILSARSLIVHHDASILDSSALLSRVGRDRSKPTFRPHREACYRSSVIQNQVCRATLATFGGIASFGLGFGAHSCPLSSCPTCFYLGGITIYAAIPMFKKTLPKKHSPRREIMELLESLWTILHSWHPDNLSHPT
jgi:hypothetical protein